jgi:hypothetical protein
MNGISPKALRLLAHFATENINSRPASVQVEIYEALSDTLPTQRERLSARHLAFSIKETAKLQMEFSVLVENRAAAITDRAAAKTQIKHLKSKI